VATKQSARAVRAFSFAELEATPRELKLWAWDRNGQLLDQAVLARKEH
jgi:hypothetical protein